VTVTLLIGEPCVGKSAIARAILARGEWEFRPVKYVAHHAGRVLLLGVYEDGQQFPGTDRLSMACQPHAVEFCKAADRPVVIEGDRLGNQSFITALRMNGIPVRIGHVVCSPAILAAVGLRSAYRATSSYGADRLRLRTSCGWGGHTRLRTTRPTI
jgi:hypothetical protein